MKDISDTSEIISPAMECMRCGICCTRYQAIAGIDEMRRIAAYLGISDEEWINLYSEPRWHSDKNYLIRHVDSACIFLGYGDGISFCGIHPVRSSCCSEWVPGMDKAECREGMGRIRK